MAVLIVVALLGASGGAWYFLRAAPHVQAAGVSDPPASASPGASPSTEAFTPIGVAVLPSGPPSPSTASELVVDVVGKVAKPGVFRLPPGSRIVDAIAAAGGVLPHTDLTALDLARKLSDGQEIFVGVPPPSGPAAMSAGGVVGDDTDAGSDADGSSPDSIVNINSATEVELETLPGVGVATAQKILAWRTQHGRFTSVTQLQQVSGIGPAKYAALAGRVKV